MRAMGVSVPIRYLAERKEVKHAYCSHEKFAEAFPHRDPTPLAEGVRRMARWARQVWPGPRFCAPPLVTFAAGTGVTP